MAYCVLADLKKRIPEADLIQLTDDDGYGVVDTDVTDEAIANADEEIDAYVSVRYSLPFDSTPGLVKFLSIDLAVCWLYERIDHVRTPEAIAERCKRARDTLDRIAMGRLNLDVPNPTESTNYGVGVTTVKTDRVFTRGRDSDSSTGTLDNY